MNMFQWLDMETISSCNRTCPTCLRNSHPDRDAVKSWFKKVYLDEEIIEEALRQIKAMGFTGGVRLSHFNEPLMDERLPDLARLVQSYGYKAYINTNGDFITESLAGRLDGAFEQIIVTLYMNEPIKTERANWIYSLFKSTEIIVIKESDHIPSHFSPKFDVVALAEEYQEHPCSEPAMRCIINHKGQFLLCCEDLIGNFGLGTFPETSINDYWFGEKRKTIQITLENRGGRHWNPYCESCPKS